jgi:hypothetical protein
MGNVAEGPGRSGTISKALFARHSQYLRFHLHYSVVIPVRPAYRVCSSSICSDIRYRSTLRKSEEGTTVELMETR